MCSSEDLPRCFYNAFLRQDYENDNFDVIFYVDREELYAHGQILSFASDIFKKQILQNRSKGNGPIQIDGYSYDEFFEFIWLIYCFDDFDGDREPDEDKICAVIELASIYGINEIKEYAGNQLAYYGGFQSLVDEEELTNEDIKDIFEKIEFAHKYSLKRFKEHYAVQDCLNNKISTLTEYNDFINLNKLTVTAFLHLIIGKNCEMEKLNKAIYKWGEYQAMVTVEMPEKEKNQLILHQIKEFLPFFDLKNLVNFFAKKKDLITIDEANILRTIEVSITCNDKTITGTFIDGYGIHECIESHEKERLHKCGPKKYRFWYKAFKRPSTPSTVEKMKGCEWYLLLDEKDTKLYVKHRSIIEENDYLIAEMKYENGSGDGEFMIERYGVYATSLQNYFFP